jgi:thiamine biosynthesis protein ThiS
MKVKINGEEKVFDEELTLKELVEKELNSDEPKGVAAALNYNIVPKQKWNETKIKDNDEIEIVHAVQGG